MNDPLIFLDANVLLDIILPERPRLALVQQFLADTPAVAISALSVHLAVHFGQKAGLQRSGIEATLAPLLILPINGEAVQWAFANVEGDDFEDALQVAAAVQNGCQKFVTSDVALARRYHSFIDMKLLA